MGLRYSLLHRLPDRWRSAGRPWRSHGTRRLRGTGGEPGFGKGSVDTGAARATGRTACTEISNPAPSSQTVRLSSDFASVRDKARVFRQFGDYGGRQGRLHAEFDATFFAGLRMGGVSGE
jgi:hypothetical protein